VQAWADRLITVRDPISAWLIPTPVTRPLGWRQSKAPALSPRNLVAQQLQERLRGRLCGGYWPSLCLHHCIERAAAALNALRPAKPLVPHPASCVLWTLSFEGASLPPAPVIRTVSRPTTWFSRMQLPRECFLRIRCAGAGHRPKLWEAVTHRPGWPTRLPSYSNLPLLCCCLLDRIGLPFHLRVRIF
jgi:hypothetical protein